SSAITNPVTAGSCPTTALPTSPRTLAMAWRAAASDRPAPAAAAAAGCCWAAGARGCCGAGAAARWCISAEAAGCWGVAAAGGPGAGGRGSRPAAGGPRRWADLVQWGVPGAVVARPAAAAHGAARRGWSSVGYLFFQCVQGLSQVQQGCVVGGGGTIQQVLDRGFGASGGVGQGPDHCRASGTVR